MALRIFNKLRRFYLRAISDSDTLKYFFKSPLKSFKYSTYFKVYDQLFYPYKNKKITFLEIGVGSGGSLFMWRYFFGKKARIIGIDLNPEAKKLEKYGFEIFVGSQKDKKFLQEVKKKIGKIDIILDDGGHMYDQQIITTEFFIGSVNDGGMVVIEDTHSSYVNGFGSSRFSFIKYVKELIDKINNRFCFLNKKLSEKKIWSLEIFESFVVFKINRKALNIKSFPIQNKGKFIYKSEDFRYKDKNKVDLKRYFVRNK